MADPLGPAWGNPNLRAQVDRTRQNQAQARTYEDTWIDNFFQGLMGKEDIGAGVLDRSAGSDKRITANEAGQVLGITTDLMGPLKTAGLAALAAVPLMGLSVASGGVKNAGKRAQLGAVRIGGAKDLVATHAFDPQAAPSIAAQGVLDAPSIGITSRTGNQYSPNRPQFVFRAGYADPEKQIGTLINRDGYFSNPRAYEHGPEVLKERIVEALAAAKKIHNGDDLRLGQLLPGDVGQTMAILASPNFQKLKDFEKSPMGAATLRTKRSAVDSTNRNFTNEVVAKTGLRKDQDKLLAANFNAGTLGLTDDLKGVAAKQPSEMAEYKAMQQLPITPQDAAIFVPTHAGISAETLSYLEPLRAKGFKFFNTTDLGRPTDLQDGVDYVTEALKRLPNVADSSGQLKVPLRVAAIHSLDGTRSIRPPDIWEDFLAGKYAKDAKPYTPMSTPTELSMDPALFQKMFGLDPAKVNFKGPSIEDEFFGR